jgi:hypothetical protein
MQDDATKEGMMRAPPSSVFTKQTGFSPCRPNGFETTTTMPPVRKTTLTNAAIVGTDRRSGKAFARIQIQLQAANLEA